MDFEGWIPTLVATGAVANRFDNRNR